jgi:hypothetical protein
MLVVVLVGGEQAWAAPTCTAEPAGKGVAACLLEVDPGGEILLQSGATYEIGSLPIRKDVHIRAITPSSRAILVHKPTEILPNPVFGSSYPIVFQAALSVSNGASVTVTDVEIRPYLADTEFGRAHLSRALEVSGGAKVKAEGVLVQGVTAPRKGSPSSFPGGYGGHVSGAGSTLTVVNSEFRNIDASEHLGGAFFADGGGTLQVLGRTTIEANRAYKGGGALARFGGIILVDRQEDTPQFVDNRAAAGGGAIAIERSGSVLRVVEGQFVGNTATSWGGHILVFDAELNIETGEFKTGNADIGGAIYVYSSTASLAGADFTGNRAGTTGGAVAADGSSIALDSVHFLDNATETEGEGGAVHARGGTVTVRAASFEGNQAGLGGALALRDVTAVDVSVGWFVDNIASTSGGAVWSGGVRGTESFWWNQFCGNQASQGSALAFSGDGTSLRSLEFTNNLVDGYTATFAEAVRVEWRDFTIDQNNFVRGGGQAVRTDAASGSFRRNLVAWQDAESALYADDGTVPTLVENAFWDPGSLWDTPVSLKGAAVSAGADPVFEDPLLTGAAEGALAVPCSTTHHHLRPNSPLILVPWDDPSARYEQIGMFGGPSSPSDPWNLDQDGDGVVAYWDCDDSDSGLGMRLEQYFDSDGDGYTDTLFEQTWPCTLLEGNTLTAECLPGEDLCTDDNGSDTDAPGASEVYWYGGCQGGGGAPSWAGLAAAMWAFRRRRARSGG